MASVFVNVILFLERSFYSYQLESVYRASLEGYAWKQRYSRNTNNDRLHLLKCPEYSDRQAHTTWSREKEREMDRERWTQTPVDRLYKDFCSTTTILQPSPFAFWDSALYIFEDSTVPKEIGV